MTLKATTFFGRQAYQLANDQLSLLIVPAFSGRVMELNYGGKNYLWVNLPLLKGEIGGDPTFGNWMNWGGYKTWLAPQSEWLDPEVQSDEMDNVEWEIVAQTETELELRGPVISWGGVQLGRRLALEGAGPKVRVQELMFNPGKETRTWAVWAVAQFPIPGWATYPPNGQRKILVPPAQPFHGDQLRFRGDAKWKVGALTAAGWGSYHADSWPAPFRVKFPVQPKRRYPDECSLETWSNTRPSYMELEWLGPLVTLAPGEGWTFETEWDLF